MAGYKRAAIVADDDEQFDTRDLVRLTAWGLGAVVGVTVVVFIARTDLGIHRARAALMAIAATPEESASAPTAQLLARSAAIEREARRAIETAQAISADRERMAMRVAAVEQNLGDVNGAVQRALTIAAETRANSQFPSMSSAALLMSPKNPAPNGWSPPPLVVAAASPVAAAPVAPPAAVPPPVMATAPEAAPVVPINVPLPRPTPLAPPPQTIAAKDEPAPAPAAAKPDETTASVTGSVDTAPTETPLKVEFGADLGPALTMTRLRSRWAKLSTERPDLVKGLRPLVTVRELGPGKPVEIRLVVGPIANVNAATDFCSILAPAQYLCRPAVFDGQRLTVP